MKKNKNKINHLIFIRTLIASFLLVFLAILMISNIKQAKAELSIQTTKSYSLKTTFDAVSPQYISNILNFTLPTTSGTNTGGNFTFTDYYNHLACVNISANEQLPQSYYYITCNYTMSYQTSSGYILNIYLYFYRDYTLYNNYAYVNYIVNFNAWGTNARISTPTTSPMANQTLLLMNLMQTNETHMTFISRQQGDSNVYSSPNLETESQTYKILMLCFNQYDSEFASTQQAYQSGYSEGEQVGYQNGYRVGKDDGYQLGYNDGYDYGEQVGYQNGYNNGYDDGVSASNNNLFAFRNVLSSAWGGATSFLNTPIFGPLTILHVILLPLTLGILIVIIKLIRG